MGQRLSRLCRYYASTDTVCQPPNFSTWLPGSNCYNGYILNSSTPIRHPLKDTLKAKNARRSGEHEKFSLDGCPWIVLCCNIKCQYWITDLDGEDLPFSQAVLQCFRTPIACTPEMETGFSCSRFMTTSKVRVHCTYKKSIPMGYFQYWYDCASTGTFEYCWWIVPGEGDSTMTRIVPV